MKTYYILIFLLSIGLISNTNLNAQNNSKVTDENALIDLSNLDDKFLNELVLSALNKQLIFNNHEELQLNTVLKNAAEDQAEFMVTKDDAVLEQSGDKATTGDRVLYYGGSTFAAEFVCKIPAMKGKEASSYKQLADDIVFKWFNTKKSLALLKDPNYIFVGIGIAFDDLGKKAFVSLVLGNYKSFNNGANRKNELDVPYSTKQYKLQAFDEKNCKNCNKFKDIEKLSEGLSVRDGKIIFKYNNLKELKKLMKKPKDGLAVDVVQKEQFSCTGDAIVDNNLISKGILLKPVYSKKLFKKNLILGKKVKQIEVELGTLPNVPGKYELNLLVIQNKYVCRNIVKPFTIEAQVEYASVVRLLADTITINSEMNYVPQEEKTSLTFKIPFEKNKYSYKPEDIEPFLKSLNEPDFIINNLKIAAYSSIEGGETQNKMLQEKRAESIISAMKNRQKVDLKADVITSENWDDLKTDVQNTKFSKLASMSLNEAKQYITDNAWAKDMEPILAKHRYATISMDVTYEIAGDKEEAFVVSRFNKAIEEKNRTLALSIQKYIFKKVLDGKYSENAVLNQKIPLEASFAGILMNKLWLEKYIGNDELDETYCERINGLMTLDQFNSYILYNKYYCDILYGDLGDDNNIKELQDKITELYFSTLSKPTVDALNLEYQFKIIETLDTLDTPHPLLLESLDRIKSIVDLKEANWQNALKLSFLFMRQKDYDFAAKLLEPYTDQDAVFEELIYTYISLCSHTPYRLGTGKFIRAMAKAREMNPKRFCELFNGKQFSFQVFEITPVKEEFCKYCK